MLLSKTYPLILLMRCELNNQTPLTLKDFVLRNDDHLYGPNAGLATLIDRAEVRLINSSTSFSGLYRALSKLDLSNEERLRPTWDLYFMQLASLAAQRSNCMKRRVGCVLVRERRVISTGYNGTPRKMQNCNEGGCKLDRFSIASLVNSIRSEMQWWSRSWDGTFDMPVYSCRRKCST